MSDEPGRYDCLDFCHVRCCFRLERHVIRSNRGCKTESREVVYGITSLKREDVSEERLLELIRHHWTIENRVHWVRDVTYDEDRCRIRTQNGPRMMASIRNLAISIARMMGFQYIPDAIRAFTFCRRRNEVLAAWGIY